MEFLVAVARIALGSRTRCKRAAAIHVLCVATSPLSVQWSECGVVVRRIFKEKEMVSERLGIQLQIITWSTACFPIDPVQQLFRSPPQVTVLQIQFPWFIIKIDGG
jgi:hypothetical protein